MFDAQSLRLVDGKCPAIGTAGLTSHMRPICGICHMPPPLLLNPIDAEHNCCRLLGAYAGTRGNWSMIGSPRMFKFSCRTWQSMKSMSGSNWPLFCTADSFTNLADMSGCDAGTAFEPSTSAGDQCSNRPCVPFAKRWSCTVEIMMRPSTHRQVLRGQLSRNIRKCASHRKQQQRIWSTAKLLVSITLIW